ncbi:discoidin domain-containing protein [Oerskovia sp. NPDC060287]|uniref:discoidin domain-containing protein n=1 Tax=Oerskovia sp. NPDC060287 TaxID=3347095 RepID=UPI00365F7A94
MHRTSFRPRADRAPEPRPSPRPGRRTLRTAVVALTSGSLLLAGLTTTASAATQPTTADPSTAPASAAPSYGAPDATAAKYYEALLRHTRWVESVYDPAAGVYQLKDMNFAVVLGNAVLVTQGEYDAELAGISRADLKAHTLSTITHYAASNRLVNPQGTWGRKLFWESTFQSYFLAAGRLLWDDLDATTRANLTKIATEQSRYAADLNFAQDPLSGSWNAHWPTGGYKGDTAQEEVGVYTQALAPGLAWAPDDPDADRWADQLATWGRNAAGQPTADRNNPAVVAGAPVSDNTMQNVYDTYIVENHGSFGPHYQSDVWRSGARNAIHFLLAGEPIPEILLEQPNSAELWRSIQLVMSEQGEPFMPMVNDREFLYGRDVLPVAFLGQVLRDPDAARAEASLADALADYQMYAPVYRLTKFSGEAKYEPEARAEIAISYLLHVASAESPEGPVTPTPSDELFDRLAGVRDFGAGPGLVVQQSANAWAGAVSRQGFVKFPWVPEQDSWLFHLSGSSPFLYPSASAQVSARSVDVSTAARDGFDGTASVFRIGDGYAGQVTLPTGSAIYASTGAGPTDGTVTVRNLDMGGYNGLDGSRTYTTADGEVTAANPVVPAQEPADANAARVDDLPFDQVQARYVRMKGIRGNATYGYSMYAFHAYGPDGTVDLAARKPATASSQDAEGGRTAARVTDGSPTTRWAVSKADRTRADSWIQVDLGAERTLASVRLAWEVSAGAEYTVETSLDGTTWTVASRYGKSAQDANVARLDTVDLTAADGSSPAPARFVRMQGVRGNADYGYSLYHLRAFGPLGATNLAAGRPATASSADDGKPATAVTDGRADTRWAVSRTDRTRPDSWVQIDLGTVQDVSRVELGWEASAGDVYVIQTSTDGTTWHDAGRHEEKGDEVLRSQGGWINIEGKGGFVVRGTDAPLTVSRSGDAKHVVRLADGATGPRLVEAVVGDAAATAQQAARAVPTSSSPGTLVSALDGYLSVFNLTGAPVTTTVTVAHDGTTATLYPGTQRVTAAGSQVEVSVPAGSAVVLAPRATLDVSQVSGSFDADVTDARTVLLTSAAPVSLVVRNAETGDAREVAVPGKASPTTLRFRGATPFPVADHALSTLTFPASVLPSGMTSPSLAVDGDASTVWSPGSAEGRMVTDLGAPQEVGRVVTRWDGDAPAATVSVSDDGLTYTDVGRIEGGSVRGSLDVGATTRYVALTVDGWAAGGPGLSSLRALAPGAADPELATDLSIGTTVTTRCTAGVQYLSVRVVNGEQVPLDVVVRTPAGTKTFAGVAPGRSASQTFRVRDAADATGVVETTASGTDGGITVVESPFQPATCG